MHIRAIAVHHPQPTATHKHHARLRDPSLPEHPLLDLIGNSMDRHTPVSAVSRVRDLELTGPQYFAGCDVMNRYLVTSLQRANHSDHRCSESGEQRVIPSAIAWSEPSQSGSVERDDRESVAVVEITLD